MELMTTMKTMAEVLEEHYIDITITSPDRIGSCVCGEWTAGTMSISWDEHQADALTAAGFGLVADAGAKALEDAAAKVMGPSDVLLDGATCRWIAMELRERAAAVRDEG